MTSCCGLRNISAAQAPSYLGRPCAAPHTIFCPKQHWGSSLHDPSAALHSFFLIKKKGREQWWESHQHQQHQPRVLQVKLLKQEAAFLLIQIPAMSELTPRKQKPFGAAGNLSMWGITIHHTFQQLLVTLRGQDGLRSHSSEVSPDLQALYMLHVRNFLCFLKAGKQLSLQPEWELLGAGVRKESQTQHLLQGCLCSAAQRLSRTHSQLGIRKAAKSGLQGSFKSNLKSCL